MSASVIVPLGTPELDLGETASLRLSAIRRRIALITTTEPNPSEPNPFAGLGTGIAELDAALSRCGVPRGRLTEVTGTRGSGKATLLLRLVMETIARGLGAAYVDASRTLAPRDWACAASAAGDGFWVVRPKQASRGAWCADVLLRSGAFALVVLDGAPPLPRAIAVRLTRLAHDSAAALVVVGGDHAPPTMLSGALRLHVSRARLSRMSSNTLPAASLDMQRGVRHAGADPPLPPGAMTRWMTIAVEKGGRRGQRQTVEVEHAVNVANRLCAHPEVPDRRGAARTSGGGRKEKSKRRIDTGQRQPEPEHVERQRTEHQQSGQQRVERQRIPELASVG